MAKDGEDSHGLQTKNLKNSVRINSSRCGSRDAGPFNTEILQVAAVFSRLELGFREGMLLLKRDRPIKRISAR